MDYQRVGPSLKAHQPCTPILFRKEKDSQIYTITLFFLFVSSFNLLLKQFCVFVFVCLNFVFHIISAFSTSHKPYVAGETVLSN